MQKSSAMNYYKIKNLEQYIKAYKKSVNDPEEFWGDIADKNFIWYQKWDKVLHNDMLNGDIKWFVNGKLNMTRNCLDRHLNKRGDKTAIIFEPNDPNEEAQHITYKELHKKVCKMANVLRDNGIKKGDRVCIYLPMIPELPIALLACARVGAIHSVVFAGFSANSLSSRIQDSDCKMLITSDGGYRGNKTIDLKGIADDALKSCPSIETVLVAKRIDSEIHMEEGRDKWLQPLMDDAAEDNVSEIMDAEDPLFILYTSGSTGKPKGMVHTTAGYMVFTAYTFTNVFNYKEDDIYWCTADIGWITGHSYIVYGPLLNGATTVLFEGIPSYPDFGRFWDVIDKHKVTQLYTAPTAIRALAKENLSYVESHDLSSLRVLGSVGEPINEEAWHWYNNNIGKQKCPVVDTWWQTENGGIMISPLPFITPTKPTYATMPLPGIQPVLMNSKRNEVENHHEEGSLCIKFPWPGMARTIWGNHERYKETYFSAFRGKYFSGDGALKDEVGYYRIIGRIDDVIIVSGHNLGTAPIENAINEHPAVAESAIVGYPHDIKGNGLYGYITLKETGEVRDRDNLRREINEHIANHIGPIAKLDKIQFVDALPKTRSGKIMRRILRKIAAGDFDSFGDISTLLNPESVDEIKNGRIA
ncbi:MAG: acetate--CoA ligase [Moheibacter sp.]